MHMYYILSLYLDSLCIYVCPKPDEESLSMDDMQQNVKFQTTLRT